MEGFMTKDSEENPAEQGDHHKTGTSVIGDGSLSDKPQGVGIESGISKGSQ